MVDIFFIYYIERLSVMNFNFLFLFDLQAAKALKLSSDALWRFIRRGPNDFPGGDITESISEACTWSAFHLDVLHQCGSEKMEILFLGYLENWSVAHKKCSSLPGLMSMIKRWVKVIPLT